MNSYDKFNLNEISEFVKLLTNETEVFEFDRTIYTDNVNYNIYRFRNTLIISSTDGKRLEINIKPNVVEEQQNAKKTSRVVHTVSTKYSLNDSKEINLISKVSSSNGTYLLYELNDYDLLRDYKLYYLEDNKAKAELSIDLNKIKLCNSDKIFEFENKDYVKEGNKVISLSDNRLLKINKNDAPKLELIYSFDLSAEKQRISNIIKSNYLHPITKSLLENTNKLFKKTEETVNAIKNYYDCEIIELENVKHLRKCINSNIDNNLFTSEELSKILESLNYNLDNKNEKKLSLNNNI